MLIIVSIMRVPRWRGIKGVDAAVIIFISYINTLCPPPSLRDTSPGMRRTIRASGGEGRELCIYLIAEVIIN
jgi:hypothetical protein